MHLRQSNAPAEILKLKPQPTHSNVMKLPKSSEDGRLFITWPSVVIAGESGLPAIWCQTIPVSTETGYTTILTGLCNSRNRPIPHTPITAKTSPITPTLEYTLKIIITIAPTRPSLLNATISPQMKPAICTTETTAPQCRGTIPPSSTF